ncbi:hypothetical protein [Nonomuraea sp. 10N515B]|uniref:hypothetical protein n=1 Tax=Nonomuraea sp. 10N515B TaxID=3457422 RepID=UPI003FCD4C85
MTRRRRGRVERAAPRCTVSGIVLPLDQAAAGCEAMAERRATRVLARRAVPLPR